MRTIFWVLIVLCIILCVVAWYVAYIIILIPSFYIWNIFVRYVTNALGRIAGSYFTRGIVFGFWVASIPIPFAYLMYFINPYIWMLFLKIDLCVWLLIAIASAFVGIGQELKPWEDI